MSQTDVKKDAANHHRWLRCFSVIAIIEAITWTGLLAGMYFKYIPETTELGVRIFGSLHGAAFICYVVITVIVARQQRWRTVWTTVVALVASVPPFGTLVFDFWARKAGLIVPRAK